MAADPSWQQTPHGSGPLTGADPSFAVYSEPLIGSDRSHDFEMRGPGGPMWGVCYRVGLTPVRGPVT